ncbi:MAG: T9SS type A sorting domain-containing protein [Bacteroidota bacterium]
MTRLWPLLFVALATGASAQPVPAWTPLNAGSQSVALPIASSMDAAGNVVVIQFPPGSFQPELARWDGTQWTVYPGTFPFSANEVAVTDAGDDVYVNFRSPGTVTNGNGTTVAVNQVARYHIPTRTWDDLDGGLGGAVQSIDTDAAGNLIVGGTFTQATDGTVLSRLARWNLSSGQWEPLAGGVSGNALAVASEPGGTAIIAGDFDQTLGSGGGAVGGVARFNFSTGQWQALGAGFDAGSRSVRGIVSDGTNVTVIGSLLRIGGVAQPVYRWNGTAWSSYAAIGDVAVNTAAIARDGAGTTYVFGNTFSNVFRSGFSVHARAAGGASWTLVAHVPNTSSFRTMAANASRAGAALFLGGQFFGFEGPNGTPLAAANFAEWNGSAWTTQQPPFVGINGTVFAAEEILPVPPANTPSSVPTNRFMAVGGDFTDVATVAVNRIALYDGVVWDDPGQGVTDPAGIVRTILPMDLYEGERISPPTLRTPFVVGGTFSEVTNDDGTPVPVSNIAEWDFAASSWRSFGQGVSLRGAAGTGAVHALAYARSCFRTREPSYIYVGGQFDTATNADGSTVAVQNLARYNLSTGRWESAGGGAQGPVYALEVIPYAMLTIPDAPGRQVDHMVFVGGAFPSALDATGTPVPDTPNLAWLANDGTWRGMGRGTSGPVYALEGIVERLFQGRNSRGCGEVLHASVYVGGAFTNVITTGPQLPASNLARWNQYNEWEVMGLPFGQGGAGTPGNGVNGTVRSIRMVEGKTTHQSYAGYATLAIGGDFTEAYDELGRTISSPHAVRLVDYREALFPDTYLELGPELYESIGGGTDGPVQDIGWTTCQQPTGHWSDTYYVGGRFTTVGGSITSPGLAKWRDYLPPPPVRYTSVAVVSPNPNSPPCTPARCGRAVVTYQLPYNPTCLRSTLGRTANGPSANDPISLGEAAFGETVVTTGTQPDPDLPLVFEIRDETGAVLATDTVSVETLDPVTFVLTGVDVPSAFAANPDGQDTGLRVRAVQVTGTELVADGMGLVRFVNAVTDAPPLDVTLPDGTVLADSVAFDSLASSVEIPFGTPSVQIRRDDDGSLLGTFDLELTEEDDVQVAVISGFLDPSANQDGPGLTLVAIPVEAEAPVSTEAERADEDVQLLPVAPNPVTDAATIRFRVPRAQTVSVDVLDVLGRHVTALLEERTTAGAHTLTWDADGLASGVYLVRLSTEASMAVQRMTVVR